MTTLVSLNGEIVGPEEAKISVFDRGFLYGDSIYEVIRTYQGVPFELDAHLRRLQGSAERLLMTLPVPLAKFSEEISGVHKATGNTDSYLRVVVTRGSGEIGLDPALAENPIRLVVAKPMALPPATVYADGAAIALVSVRRNLRAAIDPRAKTGNYLNSVMALAEARQRGAFEAVMLDHREFVTEGASSNVFVVKDGRIMTPPIDAGILEGVTRAVVLKVARESVEAVMETPLTEDSLTQADEVFITSSIREVVPIVQVDDQVIGTGKPGPVYKKIKQVFADYVDEYVKAHK